MRTKRIYLPSIFASIVKSRKWGKEGNHISQKSGFKVLGSKSLYYLIEVRNNILWRTCICKIHDDFKSNVYAYYILIKVHRLCFLVNLLLLSILCQYRLQKVIFTLRLIHLQASKCIKLNFVFLVWPGHHLSNNCIVNYWYGYLTKIHISQNWICNLLQNPYQ